jgi:hypothetical protein
MMPVSPKSWGYVYIVRTLERYKIGWSSDLKTLKKRLNRLHLMNGYGIEPVLIIRSRRAHRIERDMHEAYQSQSTHGEWFCLRDDDITAIQNRHHRNIFTAEELKVW